jgi:hypothetical protein
MIMTVLLGLSDFNDLMCKIPLREKSRGLPREQLTKYSQRLGEKM